MSSGDAAVQDFALVLTPCRDGCFVAMTVTRQRIEGAEFVDAQASAVRGALPALRL
jgi:hypothetical protein